jgi:hypothetical protein
LITGSIRQRNAADDVRKCKSKHVDESGKPVDVENMIREREKKVKEENAKNNNVLELDLLK